MCSAATPRRTRFCTADKNFAHFGLLLAKTGHAVATDGHRLLIQCLPSLQALPEDLLVEPNGLDVPGFGTEPASLTVKLDEVEIETSADHWAWGLRRDVFPDYRKVLPEHPRLVVEIDPERLNRAFADVEPFLAPRHPPLEGFVYTPAVEIEITAHSFSLTTTDVMGYHACNGVESRPAPPDDRWRHEASFHIDTVTGHSDVFRFGVNAHYLADSLNAVTEGDVCTLALFAPHRSVVFANGDGTRTAVTMPMG